MPEEIKINNHPINEIFADLSFYKEPKLLKEEFGKLLDVGSVNIGEIEKYLELLLSIQYAWKKVLKYEKYFDVFYTSDESIKNFEALTHHIEAYLQDVDTLKNKIKVFFGVLKNDLKKFALNKKEVINFIDTGIKKNDEVFGEVIKYRIPHVHRGMRFIDSDLLKAENADFAIETLSNNPLFSTMLNQKYKSQFIEKLKNEKEKGFKAAKIRMIKTAHNNNDQISKYLRDSIKAIRPSLYQFLNIRPVNDIIAEVKKTKL